MKTDIDTIEALPPAAIVEMPQETLSAAQSAPTGATEETIMSNTQSELPFFNVLGAHPNRNFFSIRVQARNALCAFGAAARELQEAGEEGDAEFYAAIPSGVEFEMAGESVVTLETVLDPEQAEVFGLAQAELDAEAVTPDPDKVARMNNLSPVDKFNYQLLGRLQQDCEYYLGNGNRAKKHLWAGDEVEQIAKMKEVFAALPEAPEWITLKKIEEYEAAMVLEL